jgi:hypothetical protein
MNAKNVKKEFLRYLAARGESVQKITPSRALESVLAFYLEVRAEGCDLTADQNMLLFQWGTYDWGKGEHFEVDLARQFIFGDGEDEDVWQFHVMFRFAPIELFRQLANGDRWCKSLEELPEFTSFVRGHPATLAVGSRTDAVASLDYECAG